MATTLLHRYEPRGTARVLLQARDREIVIAGPAGTGKSRGCLMKVLLAALKYPGMRALFVRQTADSLRDSTMVEWRDTVARETITAGECVFYSGSRTEPPGYRFSNGSRISLGGMDKPTKIMSRQYDLVFVDEATELTLEGWQALKTRLRHGRLPYQQLLAACNPDAPTHWLKRRADDGVTLMLHSRHWENPRWYEPADTPGDQVEEHEGRLYRITPAGVDYLHGTLGDLTGITRLRMLDGHWCASDGVVWENWDPAIHLVDPYPIPAAWPRYWVVDFGYRNPFCCQWWAETPDGQLVRYREIYHTGRLVEDHAKQMLRLVTAPSPGVADGQATADELDPLPAVRAGRRQWVEPRPQVILADHDAEDRATLFKHLGMATKAANKRVKRGIEAVETRLKPDRRGIPGMVFMKQSLVERDDTLVRAGRPTCTEEEIPQYVWAPAVNGRAPKEEPLKENDHGCDTTRYLAAHKDLRAALVTDRDPWA